MGLGGFGGGEGAARFLAQQGVRVTVTDLRPEAELAAPVSRLADLPIEFHLGGHVESDFAAADAVIVNPAVKPGSPWLALARRHGARLDTEVNLFLRLCPAPVVGVTGSNGKSTTATLAWEMLRRSRPAWLGGNLGGSLLADLPAITPGGVVVVELSSFQLDRLAWGAPAPAVAVALNLNPNHIDWHGDFAAYEAAKRNICAMQRADGWAVLNAADPRVAAWRGHCGGRVFEVGGAEDGRAGAWLRGSDLVLRAPGREERASLASLPLAGPHHRMNAACAASAAWLLGAGAKDIEAALAAFKPLAHRMETVAVVDGVTWVNDSKATTPEAAIAALNAFDGPIHLIAGGSPKGTPFDELGRAIATRATTAALIGQTAPAIEAAVRACPGNRAEILRPATLAQAVEELRRRAGPGSVVLLSPACASFDLFRSYADRGDQFRRLANAPPAAPNQVV